MIAIVAYTAVEVVTMIGALSGAIIGIIGAWRTGQVNREVTSVKREVTTMNAQSLAQLTDAVETRRVNAIPEEDRTAQESDHISHAPGH